MAKFGLASLLKIIIFLHLSVIAWFINYLIHHSLFSYKVYGETKKVKEIKKAYVKEIDYYFKAHRDFINEFASSSVFDGHDPKKFLTKLMKIAQAQDRFNRFFVANTDGSFYTNDNMGNEAKGGIQTFDNNDPNSSARTVVRRDYWIYTVGTNTEGELRSYVSPPFISYVRGVRQIVFTTSLVRDGKTNGLVGGTVDGELFSKFMNHLKKSYHLDDDYWISVIHESGTYWHHFDARKKVAQIQDQSGNKIYDEHGEVIAMGDYIQYDKNPQLANIGKEIIKGLSGEGQFNYDDSFLTSSYGPLVETKNYSILVGKVVKGNKHYYFFALMIFFNFFLTNSIYYYLRKFI